MQQKIDKNFLVFLIIAFELVAVHFQVLLREYS